MRIDAIELLNVERYKDLRAIIRDDPHISQRDRWSAMLWHLDGYLPGYGSTTIGWDFDAPPGVIDALKLVAADLFIRKPKQQQARYQHTVGNLFAQSAKYLGRFMVDHDYRSFAELDEEAFEAFKTALANTVAKPSDNADVFVEAVEERSAESRRRRALGQEEADYVEDGVDADPEESPIEDPEIEEDTEADSLTQALVQTRLYAWEYLKIARPALERCGVATSAFYPFERSSIRAAAMPLIRKALDEVDPLPDAVSIPILNAAWRLLGKPADDIIRLQAAYLDVRADPSLGSKTRKRALRELVESFDFSKLDGEVEPWRRPIIIQTEGGVGSLELRRLVRLVHVAAVVMVLAGTGMRISEVMSIEVDDREIDEELPSCIKTRPSRTEMNEHFFLQALLSKNQPKPTPHEWLLGSRPMLAHAEPTTVRAIRVLEQLLQPWRRMAPTAHLHRQLQVSLFGAGFPQRPKGIRPIRGHTLADLMREFYAMVGLKALLNGAISADPKLEVYAATNGRCIHPHQWRHTYYEFMIRLDERLLPAVSLHFKHTTLAATENGYGSKDASIRERKDAIRVREAVNFFTKRRFGTAPAVGNLSKEIERHRKALEQIVGDLPGVDAEKRTKAFVLEHDLRIWPAEHGSCLIALNPTGGRCRQASGTNDWRVGAPDLSTRTPGLCCGCPNFSVGQENAGFWRRRYIENRTAWIESNRNPLFRVALQRAVQAAAILRQLGEPVPIVLQKPLKSFVKDG